MIFDDALFRQNDFSEHTGNLADYAVEGSQHLRLRRRVSAHVALRRRDAAVPVYVRRVGTSLMAGSLTFWYFTSKPVATFGDCLHVSSTYSSLPVQKSPFAGLWAPVLHGEIPYKVLRCFIAFEYACNFRRYLLVLPFSLHLSVNLL